MDPSERIDELVASLIDWRGKTLARVRKAILAADREIVEDWKWMGSPVWSRDGMIAVGNAHKDKVKLTFSNGARLADPAKLFNAGLGGGTWRAIDLHEGDKVNEAALKELVRAAISLQPGQSEEERPSPSYRKSGCSDKAGGKESAGGLPRKGRREKEDVKALTLLVTGA